MHFSALTLTTLALSLCTSASPVMRAGGYPVIPGDNGSCQKMGQLCATTRGEDVNAIVANGTEFGISTECTLSALCQQMFYNGTVDDWIETYFGARSDHAEGQSYSLSAQRLPENLYMSLLATGTRAATAPAFAAAFNSTLASNGGPYPDAAYMHAAWTRTAAWAGACESLMMNYTQLADWFQFSSMVAGPTTC